MNMTAAMEARTNKPLTACTDQEIYLALLDIVREQSAARVRPVTGRKLYYISAEFLIGKLLSNNLINLGLYDDTRAALAAAGKNLSDIEEVEPEPSLGNGGLGRLAACFLDSLATLNLPGDGVGLRYHFGLFHQSFKDGVQNELPDPWLTAHSWAEKTDTVYPVELAGKTYSARLYKLAVTGYEGRTNTLNLFDLDTIDESIVHDGITFDKTDIDKNLTLFLYPDDSDEAGRRLRVYQQYLMVSAGAQLILAECAARGCDYHDLADYAAIQINDTHPSMVIPELIRLLGEKGIDFDEAVEIVTKTCAYTNHTILAEALEKWPRAYLDAVVPQLMPIIEKLDALARTRTTDESLAIIDGDDRVHMAHMDIHFTHSTNGVAYLHTEILKNSELHGFYQLYPEKFNNKTNVKSVKLITFGRSCVGVAFILPFKDMLKFIVLYLLLFSLLSFARHVPGTVLGVLFPCTPAKQSFRIAAGQSPFLVLRFWLLLLLFLRQHGRSAPALGVVWWSVPGQLGETGAPLPFPRCWSAWLFLLLSVLR